MIEPGVNYADLFAKEVQNILKISENSSFSNRSLVSMEETKRYLV